MNEEVIQSNEPMSLVLIVNYTCGEQEEDQTAAALPRNHPLSFLPHELKLSYGIKNCMHTNQPHPVNG